MKLWSFLKWNVWLTGILKYLKRLTPEKNTLIAESHFIYCFVYWILKTLTKYPLWLMSTLMSTFKNFLGILKSFQMHLRLTFLETFWSKARGFLYSVHPKLVTYPFSFLNNLIILLVNFPAAKNVNAKKNWLNECELAEGFTMDIYQNLFKRHSSNSFQIAAQGLSI